MSQSTTPGSGMLDQGQFRPLLVRTIVTPVLLFLMVAAVLIWQVTRLVSAADWVDHTDLVIAKAGSLREMIVEMQSSARGYMLARHVELLSRFRSNLPLVHSAGDDLAKQVGDNPSQLQGIGQILGAFDQWRDEIERSVSLVEQGGDPHVVYSVTSSTKAMEDILQKFSAFTGREEHLRDIRSQSARRWARAALVGGAGLTILCGAILALVSRRHLNALARAYDAALNEAGQLNTTLEARVAERTRQLEDVNHELEAFNYSVSHDLRAPMRHIAGFAMLLKGPVDRQLDAEAQENLKTIHDTAARAGRMVDELLALSRMSRQQMHLETVDMDKLITEIRRDLAPDLAGRDVKWEVAPLPKVRADPTMVRAVFENLLSNAVKYTSHREAALIEVGARTDDGRVIYCIRDNGVGFDMKYANKLFGVFQRLHREEEFPGTGIGLATVRRVVQRHNGETWAQGELDHGAAFYISFPHTHEVAA